MMGLGEQMADPINTETVDDMVTIGFDAWRLMIRCCHVNTSTCQNSLQTKNSPGH